jgi:hypothetical protein
MMDTSNSGHLGSIHCITSTAGKESLSNLLGHLLNKLIKIIRETLTYYNQLLQIDIK